MLILQESCMDSSGSLVVYCPVDLPAINIAMSGEDPSYIPLLPSGFAISPDGRPDQGDGASTSSNTQGSTARLSGSLITVAFQILVSSLPSAKLNLESVNTVNNLIGTTVQQIKAAMNCPSSWWPDSATANITVPLSLFHLWILRSEKIKVLCLLVVFTVAEKYWGWLGLWMPSSRTEDAYLLLLLLPVVVVPVFAATIHYDLHQLNFIYYFYEPLFWILQKFTLED